MDVGTMLDRINAYQKLIEKFGFVEAGTGVRSWPKKFVNSKDSNEVLCVRNSDWALYRMDNTEEGDIVAEGTEPKELKRLLLGRLTHEELLEFAVG